MEIRLIVVLLHSNVNRYTILHDVNENIFTHFYALNVNFNIYYYPNVNQHYKNVKEYILFMIHILSPLPSLM